MRQSMHKSRLITHIMFKTITIGPRFFIEQKYVGYFSSVQFNGNFTKF